MADVKILIEGYTSGDSSNGEEERTCPTMTLVKDGDIVMVVDPGVLESQQILVDKLKAEGLTVNDVNVVFLTHSHLDHFRNIGMFPEAKTLEFFGLWDKNTVEDWQEQFSKDIRIIKTPGHNKDCLTLLVKTEKGIIAICGDVFWKENYPETDPYATDSIKLTESRKKVLELAAYVIPGHGPMFKACLPAGR